METRDHGKLKLTLTYQYEYVCIYIYIGFQPMRLSCLTISRNIKGRPQGYASIRSHVYVKTVDNIYK